MVNVKVFVEGGGDRNPLKRQCREGFAKFLERAGVEKNRFKIVACGDRRKTYDKFRNESSPPDEIPVLLVDSEEPVRSTGTWQHLKARRDDNWDRPPGVADEQCHLMVQSMESWFLADRQALELFYRNGFQAGALPANSNIEQVPKNDVLSGLGNATRNTSKGRFHKGRHSFELLATLNPYKVTDASPFARKFVNSVRRYTT